MPVRQICSVPACGGISFCRGFCRGHYDDLLHSGKIKRLLRPHYNGTVCPVLGCEKKCEDMGMCGKHAQRVRRHGNPNYIPSELVRSALIREAQPRLGKCKPTTYKKLFGRHEHRHVAEIKIGRPLQSGEIVHHVDGNRHNNSPDNLEVMSQAEHARLHKEQEHRHVH